MAKQQVKINKTEESVFTLLFLFIQIQQAFESIYGEEEILNSEFDSENNSFHNLVTSAIHDSLRYQILLNTCAFLDEWNTYFGIKTEKPDELKIREIKRIAKPATKQISEWKQLREFRNEVIAHNHRDKDGNNIYVNSKGYNFPDTNGELYLMVYCVKKMIEIVSFFCKEEMAKSVYGMKKRKKPPRQKRISGRDIKRKINEIDKAIDGPISDIIMREQIINAYVEASNKENVSVTIL